VLLTCVGRTAAQTDTFNELTSECTGETCKVSARELRESYLGARSPLVALADEGALRESAVRTLAGVTGHSRRQGQQATAALRH